MKKTFFLFLFVMGLLTLRAQTTNEWLRQKKTKLRYLAEQIAALETYAAVVEESYFHAQKGLTLISDIKRDDLGLHQDHFTALQKMSPAVRQYWKLGACQTLNGEVENLVRQVRQTLQQSPYLVLKEKSEAGAVLDRMLAHKGELLEGLALVTTDRYSTLSDAERISQIDTFYPAFVILKEAAAAYGTSLRILSLQRERELHDVQAAAKLYKP